ncbi:MAG TPA: HAMP domain-containing sensor histidine kinase, partial [Chitinophagaceae bacterium]|nr:HAMP domain-containing sensor histidine kinase [Chitinophagaceae bacterium]
MIEQQEELEKVSKDIRRLNAELEIKVEERTLILKEALHELEKSQEDLNEALSKEKELSEIKSRFVSMASHEFRTPLSSILSSAALLSRYTKTEEQDNRDRHVRRIKDSVKHLNDLLEDFLSLGKLEEGKIMAKPERFNVKEFIADVADETKAILKKGQHFDVDCGDCADFYTDKKLLKNALINLVSNAVKFSDEEACISIRVQCQDAMLELMVKDQGIGISEDDQDHLFSSFFRGKNALNIQGTGLGLHIVKRYVDLMEGTIELQSELNKGTTITLRLPSLLEEEPTEKESQ